MKPTNQIFVIEIEENTMKFGMRQPSIKKSIRAGTTGKVKRTVKKAVIHGYGKRECNNRYSRYMIGVC